MPFLSYLFEMLQPIKMFLKYFQRYTIVHLCFMITFFVSGVILNIIQAIMYCTLRRCNKYLYRKINYYLLYSLYSQLVYLFQWWSDCKLLIYLDKYEINDFIGKEHCISIINHSYEIDWLIVWHICENFGFLGGFKAYAKKSIQYMPPVGLTVKFAEYILLDRSFEKDKLNIHRQINELGDYPDPVLLLLTAEGTRLSENKLQISQEFAKERGLPLLKHHLLPRTKGFVSSMESVGDKIKVIYDLQLAFSKDAESSPTIKTLLCGKPVTAHIYINRIPIEHIGNGEEETSKWLYQLYEKKDCLQDIFYKTGSFYTQAEMAKIKPYTLPRTVFPVINTLFWRFTVLVPLFNFLIVLAYRGDVLYFSIGFGILAIFYIMMKNAIGETEISKRSSYGATTAKGQ